MPTNTPKIVPYGDAAFLIKYESDGYDAGICDTVQGLAKVLRANGYWDEVVCGYDSVLVAFDPTVMTPLRARIRICEKIARLRKNKSRRLRTVEIPVVYGQDHGPDMENIKASSGLTEREIIGLHSGQTYRVCVMGFVPGFAFLSETPRPLHHPRHSMPRLSVKAGSVGIAGWQTGVYSLPSSGGWQIIGRTPYKLFDKNREEPFLLRAGDQVRFIPEKSRNFDD